jgi:hypothetical protein
VSINPDEVTRVSPDIVTMPGAEMMGEPRSGSAGLDSPGRASL